LPSIKPHEAAEYGDYVASEARQDAGDHLQVVKDFLTFCYKSNFTETSLAKHIKDFLTFCYKSNFTETSLAKHIKVRKAGRRTAARESARAAIDITEEGYQSLLNELEKLKGERVTVAQEISRAAADKDFRENAPLDAARDRQGLMEARIRELEDSVQRARLVDGSGSVSANQRDRRIKLGSIVRLTDPASQEEMVYTLVNASEASPMDFKMSVASPVGKALMDHHAGDEVEVATPRGSLRYRIDGVD
jgi:transcription elongation factor GreA